MPADLLNILHHTTQVVRRQMIGLPLLLHTRSCCGCTKPLP